MGAGYLWLQYSIDPVAEPVRFRNPVRDEPAGVAADSEGLALQHCRSSYSLAVDHLRVVGVLAVGPRANSRPGPLRIRFAPLVATDGLDGELCDVDVEITGSHVTHVAAYML
ncbi:hypothetical protein [uncultured Jatrophihabitans sp.]|uniref:hypothetical protein n=1 Tax=uncultured Jatrophihabitans sp. TaxID=1610747 RepID=UPI0035CC682D